MILCTCKKARGDAGFFFVVLLKECNTGALPLHPARGIMPLDLFAAKRSSRLRLR